MPPVVAAIAAVLVQVGFSAAVAAAVATFVVNVAISLAVNALFAPKNADVGARQAQTLELSLGETPREAIFGRAATGGTLANAWNHEQNNGHETAVIVVADHEIDAIEGFWIEDRFYPLTTQGEQSHPDFKDDKDRVHLFMEWRLGAQGQTIAPIIASAGVATGEWTAEEAAASFKGLAYVAVTYLASFDQVWKAGRPRFRFLVRGAKLYDPRLDSTVPGGSGPQRWGQPGTYAWSENARVCHYNFVRGVFSYASTPPQLIVGPGKSAEEAPPEEAIADMNLCDEAVPLKAGGTEPRYRASAVIRANEPWINVEEHFAAAMAGQLVERGGGIGVDPGQTKTAVFAFTDADLLSGREMTYQAKVTRDDLVNTVVARYVEPAQLWEQASAPLRRSDADIATDGEVRELSIDLVFVFSGTQAQRCAEIIRRKARLQPSAIVPLGPRFMRLEEGDWGTWTSQRRFGGGTRTFGAHSVGLDEDCNTHLALKQIDAAVFAWNPAVDELDPGSPAYLPPGAQAPAAMQDFDAEPLEITSAGGSAAGAIRATWTPQNDDLTLVGVRLEYRPVGGLATTTITVDHRPGEFIISVLPVVDVDYEIRATPVVVPVRDTLTTAFVEVALSAPFTEPEPPAGFVGYQAAGDLIRFVWTQLPDPTLEYEIRNGATFELGRFVDRVNGGATTVVWPVGAAQEDTLFWMKTRHSSGVYSLDVALWAALPGDPALQNVILLEDFQAQHFPGIRHDLFEGDVGGFPVLKLDRAGVFSELLGDYYTSVELVQTFTARTWLEYRANAYADDNTGPWQGDTEAWEDDTTDWIPTLVATPADAVLDAFISTNSALPTFFVEGWRFNDTLQGVNASSPSVSTGVTFAPAKLDNGAVVGGALAYTVALPANGRMSITADVRLMGAVPLVDTTLIHFTNAGGAFLKLFWRAADARWVLAGDYAAEIALDLPWQNDDTVALEIVQGIDAADGVKRSLKVASRRDAIVRKGEAFLLFGPQP